MNTLRSFGTPSQAAQAATDLLWTAGGYSASLVAVTTAVAFSIALLRYVWP